MKGPSSFYPPRVMHMSEHLEELIMLLDQKQRLFDQMISLNEDIRDDAFVMERQLRQMRTFDAVLR